MRTQRKAGKAARPIAQIGRAIVMRPLADLVPSIHNPRLHSPEQVAQIAASIREFGFTIPLLLDERGEIIAGHGRLLAAKKIGLAEAPVLVAAGWSEEQKRAYRIADNRITESGSWDNHLLRKELKELAGEFPVEAMGFTSSEINQMIAEEDAIEVREVKTGEVADRFWIVVRGPLRRQAEALNQLRSAMKDLGEVSVEAGTIPFDGPGADVEAW
jgi:ParB-like chromosome segregation protein Spo0J